MSLELSVKKLNELIAQKRLVDGLDAFYADDVAMVEAGGTPMVGKQANLDRERSSKAG